MSAMFDVDQFITECRSAMAERQAPTAVKEVVERALPRPHEIDAALGVPERGGITNGRSSLGGRTQNGVPEHAPDRPVWGDTECRDRGVRDLVACRGSCRFPGCVCTSWCCAPGRSAGEHGHVDGLVASAHLDEFGSRAGIVGGDELI
jgi:hypothetical protein